MLFSLTLGLHHFFLRSASFLSRILDGDHKLVLKGLDFVEISEKVRKNVKWRWNNSINLLMKVKTLRLEPPSYDQSFSDTDHFLKIFLK